MSFGEELKRERELREITLREVAEATKVNIRYLEAMERNDFEHLPGGVFNRGFVRAYSQFIGVDPESMVNSYLLEEQAQSGRTAEPATDSPSSVLRGGTRAPVRPAPLPSRVRIRSASGRGRSLLHVGVFALATVILIGVGFLVWDALRDRPGPMPTGRMTPAAARVSDG